MKKLIYVLIITLLLFTGCSKTKEEIITSVTKEEIKVTLNKEYDLVKEDNRYAILKDDNKVANLLTVTKENYEGLEKIIDKLKVIDKGESYIFYKSNEEYNYIILVKDTNTAISISSNNENSSKEVFENVSFSK